MLMLDMTGLTHRGPEKIVADHCSHFGRATIIRLLPPDRRREYGIAAVKMRSLAEAKDIARRFGDAQFGTMVLIRLIQQHKACTASTPPDDQCLAVNVSSLSHPAGDLQRPEMQLF